MRVHAALPAVAVALALAQGYLAGQEAGEKKPVLPEPVFTEVVQESIKSVQSGLAKPEAKGAPGLLRTHGALIAIAAQDAMNRPGADVGQLAALRDAALKLIEEAPGKKIELEQARKQVEVLAQFPKVPAAPGGPAGPINLREKLELADVMNLFDKSNKGGEGIEAELLTLEQQRQPFRPAQLTERVVRDAYKSALIGALTRSYDDDERAKAKPQQWRAYSDDMRKFGIELAEAVKAKQPKEAKEAVKKLNVSCNSCHVDFR